MNENTALNLAAAIDELGAAKARVAALEAFVRAASPEFEAETEARRRALGDVFQATLVDIPESTRLDHKALLEVVLERTGFRISPQLRTAHTKAVAGSTRLTVSPRKDAAAARVA